jgi:hypothetical protein
MQGVKDKLNFTASRAITNTMIKKITELGIPAARNVGKHTTELSLTA